MPKSTIEWYPRKKPHLQINILKFIASRGRSSQKEITEEFLRKPSTVSEAFRILKTRKLIKWTGAPELMSRLNRKKFYKLSPDGFSAFINENPSPEEFWIAMIWYCYLNPNHVNQRRFDRFYDSFIGKFVGNLPLHSCFFLGTFFNDLFKKWGPNMYIHHETFVHNDTTPTYKVLEYLSLNRTATVEDIILSTQLSEQEVRNILNEYSMGPYDESHYISLYGDSEIYQSSRSISVAADLLKHHIIVPTEVRRQEEEEKQNDSKYKKYELSLLGISLVLATISLMHQSKPIFSPLRYYDKIASNYQEKLTLIFGKWELLRSHLRFDWFPSIFDYLFLDKSEILSLSVLLGGNKEIYDNIKSATLAAVSKFSTVYDAGISALHSDYPEEFRNDKRYGFIQHKLDEIELLLRYSSLESFGQYMMRRKMELIDSSFVHVSLTYKDMPAWKVSEQVGANPEEKSFNFQNELDYIENALAEEFSFLFYIGLLRDNNYKASDYPLTTAFLRSSPNLVYPKVFLDTIVYGDSEIRNKITGWIKGTLNYQKLALEKIKEIYIELQNR